MTRSSQAGLALLGLVALVLFLVRPVYEFDVWWDLRMGDTILKTHQVPHYQSFLWEADQLKLPYWANDEWGFSVLVRLLWGLGGVPMLVVYMTTAALLILVLNAVTARRLGASWLSIVVAGGIYAWLIQSRMMPRPQLLDDTFLALFGLVATASPRRWWLFPVLVAIWCNFHAGCVTGVVLVGCLLVGDAIQHRFGEKLFGKPPAGTPSSVDLVPRKALWTLAGAVPVSLVAMMACPGGYMVLVYLYQHFVTRPLLGGWVAEWVPMGSGSYVYWTSVVLLMTGLLAGLRSRRTRLRHLLIAIGFTYLSAHFSRAVGEYAATTTSLLAVGLDPLLRRLENRWTLGAVAIGLVAVGWRGVGTWPQEWRQGPQVSAAMAFMRAAHISPRLFNTYHLGGMIAWDGYPEYLPFIHGLDPTYPDDVFYAYRDMTYGGAAAEAVVHHFDIQTLVLGYPFDWSQSDATGTCLRWVEQSPEWKLVYWDDDTLVYQRQDIAGPTAFVHVVPGDPSRWKPSDPGVQAELERAVALAPDSVTARCWLGDSSAIQHPDAALDAYAEATRHHPLSPLPWVRRGMLLGSLHRYAEARDALQHAWRLDPSDVQTALNLAILSFNLGDTAAGHHWVEEALKLDPTFAPALNLLHRP